MAEGGMGWVKRRGGPKPVSNLGAGGGIMA